jgi:hypothetical protein
MSALAAFRVSVLALLSDASNAIFSMNDVDQALRWALSEFSDHRPFIRTYQFTVIATTGVHILPADFITRHITKVDLYDEDPDDIVDLTFYAYQRDEQWIVETRSEVIAGEVLQISYSVIHTIDGLDSAAGTTLAAADESFIHVGAAGRAAQMRALDRIETINMNPDVVQKYRLLAIDYLSSFASFLTIEPGVRICLPDFPDVSVF